MFKRISSLFLALLFLLSVTASAFASVSAQELEAAVQGSADYMAKTVPAPQIANIGGEWAVIGLARSGCSLPANYAAQYIARVEAETKAKAGVLSTRKYTEYSRVILALTALGKDARNVGGYDLTLPLGDYENTLVQGLNGPIWALIALDSAAYPMPRNSAAKTQASRQMYIDYILAAQKSDGGWALSSRSEVSEADITGMALQALAGYRGQPAVEAAVQRGLAWLSANQTENGSFVLYNAENTESTAQVLVALAALGISPDDARFVKNGKSALDDLLGFRNANGSFKHVADGSSGDSQMSSEQGLYALVAVARQQAGKSGLYQMKDALPLSDAVAAGGLAAKNADVSPVPVSAAGKSFADIAAHKDRAVIEALAARGIINGMTDTSFAPDETMTRAQFAAITVRALGLMPVANDKFADIAPGAWYAAYIGTANRYGIVNGVSANRFNPAGTISRQEAATMVARAAMLCGLDTTLSESQTQAVLSRFSDADSVADWAAPAMAFCYESGILDATDSATGAKQPIKRCEIAEMLYNLLHITELI